MGALRLQYFLNFAVMGALLPYLPVVLGERGLDGSQIGQVMSLTGAGMMIGPVLLTLLADRAVQNRTLIGLSLTGGAALLLVLLQGVGGSFGFVLLIYGLYAVLFSPVAALTDSLLFHEQQHQQRAGHTPTAYHRVRVWGTLGFIVPSVVLYLLLGGLEHITGSWAFAAAALPGAWHDLRLPVDASLTVGAAAAILGAVNAMWLPKRPPAAAPDASPPEGAQRRLHGAPPLPTVEALRVLLRPGPLVLCLALFAIHLSVAGYYTFYPLYLTRRVGIAHEWVGLIATFGVVLEIGWMLGFGYLVHRLGMRWLLVLCGIAVAGRFAWLAASPTVGTAIWTQLLHGPLVLLVHVAPPILINRLADDRFRGSIQGVYVFGVYGVARVVGAVVCGEVAEAVSLQAVMWTACAAATVGLALLIVWGWLLPGRAALSEPRSATPAPAS
jgi:PPP family 3-phenylpropionic acid transporter